ncbi:hypothetical protein KUD11_06090 [Roseovarius sp. LXJ103]|uniref:hypothetical protein n=1 Tax=Roseovarius carneus TaxID=2853164 RepID=UPI0015E7FD5C|nr:hypothetical protein [Roseovarius carneus]MBZ8118215.1 hypothetical protein [Roseovarius carneus]
MRFAGFCAPVRGPNGQFALYTVSYNCEDAAWAAFTGQNRRSLILIPMRPT